MSDRRQDPEAFEQAVLPCLDDAYALARYLLRDEHDAQDAVQDAYLRAWRYYDPLTVADVRPWLLTIVRRCCYDWQARWRAGRSAMAGEQELRSVPDPAPGPEATATASVLREAIMSALEALPADHREVLVLRELQQLSYREIAQVVGLPIGTVMSRLSRARRRLQQALGTAEAVG